MPVWASRQLDRDLRNNTPAIRTIYPGLVVLCEVGSFGGRKLIHP
jgi:hypothetical protein